MKPTPSSRPATAEDIKRWYPDITASFRAWVCELDGEAKGIIGLALTRPYACLFSAFDEDLRPYLKSLTVLRMIKKVQAVVESRNMPVWAIAEENEPDAARNLVRLGFNHWGEVDGDVVYRWGGR